MTSCCSMTLYIKTTQHTMPALAPITRVDELRHEIQNLIGEVYIPYPLLFCPTCGRKRNSIKEQERIDNETD